MRTIELVESVLKGKSRTWMTAEDIMFDAFNKHGRIVPKTKVADKLKRLMRYRRVEHRIEGNRVMWRIRPKPHGASSSEIASGTRPCGGKG